MPGADRNHEDAAALALTTRIAHSAATAVFSYARHSDEGDRRPSPLLSALNPTPLTFATPPLPQPIQSLEQIPDNTTLPPLPDGITRGGSRILQLQAACAFRAFAETRLHSTRPETRDIGLSAMERGSLVHNVMETFWRDVATQSNLRNLSLPDRAATLAHAIDIALTDQRLNLESTWDNTYIDLERQRLVQLLSPWLEKELARPDFAVENAEQRRQFQLGPLTFKLRIDRIDATADGSLILDYKTGEADPRQWQGDRPDQPQIPLYAILAQQEGRNVAGVGFALLRPIKKLDLTGYADNPALLAPGKARTMPAVSLKEQIEQWQITLTDLANDYAAGNTRVDPKQYPQTCKHCSQRMLCRLNPDLLTAENLEEEEADNE
jgi:probable DNA repair protein